MARVHDLAALDKIRHELEERLPGWRIWYVPRSTGAVTWCAHPWPVINAQTPEQLLAEVAQAHAEASDDWPALAAAEAYGAAGRGILSPGQ